MTVRLGSFILSIVVMTVGYAFGASADAYDSRIARDAWMTLAKVENRYGIPKGLLHSMSLVETGQGLSGKVMPWPYTVGINPTGKHKFDSARMALNDLDKLRLMGFKRFNVSVDGTMRKNLSASTAESFISAAEATSFTVQGRHFSKRFESKNLAVSFVENILGQGYKNIDIGLMQINWKYHGENFTNVSEALDPYHNANYAVSYLQKHRKTRDWWGSVGRYHSGTNKHATKYIKNVWSMYQRVHRLSKSA